MSYPKNVLGGELEVCCKSPMTGFYRNGYCDTCEEDIGVHAVCTLTTEEFLQFSQERGNDLITPLPQYGFPGLKPGDKWCVCAARWKEAYDAGFAAPVVLKSTHEGALKFVPLEELEEYAADLK
jgi:uncharacterized protein (DUF2237 family)